MSSAIGTVMLMNPAMIAEYWIRDCPSALAIESSKLEIQGLVFGCPHWIKIHIISAGGYVKLNRRNLSVML